MKIKYVSGTTDLYRHYDGQTQPQDCYVYLDCGSQTLTAKYDPEIGGAVTERQWHGHVLRWRIPCLKATAANRLLNELAPMSVAICAGYESDWDGSNAVATYSAASEAAQGEIERICDNLMRYPSEGDCVRVVDAYDYFGGIQATAEAMGITADTAEEDVMVMAVQEEDVAESDGIDVLRGAEKYLLGVLEEMRRAAVE